MLMGLTNHGSYIWLRQTFSALSNAGLELDRFGFIFLSYGIKGHKRSSLFDYEFI